MQTLSDVGRIVGASYHRFGDRQSNCDISRSTLYPSCFLCAGQSAKIILPTENHALLPGGYAAFYQYVKRDFEGESYLDHIGPAQ